MVKVKLQARGRGTGKTYVFTVVVEPDEDRWIAYSPLLKSRGAATWGYTREDALVSIQEVLQMKGTDQIGAEICYKQVACLIELLEQPTSYHGLYHLMARQRDLQSL